MVKFGKALAISMRACNAATNQQTSRLQGTGEEDGRCEFRALLRVTEATMLKILTVMMLRSSNKQDQNSMLIHGITHAGSRKLHRASACAAGSAQNHACADSLRTTQLYLHIK